MLQDASPDLKPPPSNQFSRNNSKAQLPDPGSPSRKLKRIQSDATLKKIQILLSEIDIKKEMEMKLLSNNQKHMFGHDQTSLIKRIRDERQRLEDDLISFL